MGTVMDKFVIKQVQNVNGRLSGKYIDTVFSELVHLCCILESVHDKMLAEDNKRCC